MAHVAVRILQCTRRTLTQHQLGRDQYIGCIDLSIRIAPWCEITIGNVLQDHRKFSGLIEFSSIPCQPIGQRCTEFIDASESADQRTPVQDVKKTTRLRFKIINQDQLERGAVERQGVGDIDLVMFCARHQPADLDHQQRGEIEGDIATKVDTTGAFPGG